MSAKIMGFRVRAVKVPMTEPHQTASGIITESPLVLTDVMTDAGVVGRSMVFTYTAAALKPTAELIQNIVPLIEGDVLAPADLDDKLSKKFRLLGPQGLVGIALAAIDMAVWDAYARVRNKSLVELLGGEPKSIKAYGGIGYDGEAGCAASAEQWAKRGFPGVKAKIGYPTVEEDLAVIRAMKKATGNELEIMVDYNQCLSPQEAVERIRVLDEEDLTWVEEPTLAHDYAGHAFIRQSVQTPIQTGENWWGALDMQHALEAHASDFVMPDVMKIGGVSGWIRAVDLADIHEVPMSSHLWPELSARLLSCTPTDHWLEYIDWWNPILKQSLQIENGMAVFANDIGSGLEWNEEAVERFLV